MEKFGADGLRFALMRIAPSGQDIRFDEKQIEEGRNFATKLWNAARFRQMHGPSSPQPEIESGSLSIYAVEVLARLNETIEAVQTSFQEYHFNAVAQHLYDFFWSDYCDWFVESAKTDIFSEDVSRKTLALAVMDVVLSATLRLLHPFMPHITEELWTILGFGANSIQFVTLPGPVDLADAPVAETRKFAREIYETVQAGRNLRAEARVPSNKKVSFILRSHTDNVRSELPTLARLLNAEDVALQPEYQAASGVPVAVTPLGEVFLPMDVTDASAERDRLEKEIARIENELRTVRGKLSNPSFVDRAPSAVVEEHRQREKSFGEQLTKIRQALEALD
jgi:valyl-tRNA synthetase